LTHTYIHTYTYKYIYIYIYIYMYVCICVCVCEYEVILLLLFSQAESYCTQKKSIFLSNNNYSYKRRGVTLTIEKTQCSRYDQHNKMQIWLSICYTILRSINGWLMNPHLWLWHNRSNFYDIICWIRWCQYKKNMFNTKGSLNLIN